MEIKKIIFPHTPGAPIPHTNKALLMQKWLLHNMNIDIQVNDKNASFNCKDNNDCVWEIKDSPEGLIGVYFVGGSREGIGFKFTLNALFRRSKDANKIYKFFLFEKGKPTIKKKPTKGVKGKKTNKKNTKPKPKKTKHWWQ